MVRITKNFTLEEFLVSATAKANGYTEQYNPKQDVKRNIHIGVREFLQPLRDYLGDGYILISSGYRCERLEKHICWTAYKAWCKRNRLDHTRGLNWVKYFYRKTHPKGMGYDINYFRLDEDTNKYVEDNAMLYQAILDSKLQFTQLIREYGTKANPAWLHITYNRDHLKNEIFDIV